MSTQEEARDAALDALLDVLKDSAVKVEVRVEAAKIILNRPRFFLDSQDAKEV